MPDYKPTAYLRRALLLSRGARAVTWEAKQKTGRQAGVSWQGPSQRRIKPPACWQECTVQSDGGLGLTCALSRSSTPCRMSKGAAMSGQRLAPCGV